MLTVPQDQHIYFLPLERKLLTSDLCQNYNYGLFCLLGHKLCVGSSQTLYLAKRLPPHLQGTLSGIHAALPILCTLPWLRLELLSLSAWSSVLPGLVSSPHAPSPA